MSESMSKKDLATQAYTLINSNASSNAWIQGISGVAGFPFTTIADVGVIGTHYAPMLNSIRRVYGRPPLDTGAVVSMVVGIAQELMMDIVFDKVLGNIPIVGIPINAMAAKAMSWRLGILFTMLSSRGAEIDDNSVKDAVIVIRGIFPKAPFGFPTPSINEFADIVNSVFEMSHEQFNDRIQAAKDACICQPQNPPQIIKQKPSTASHM